MRKYFIYGLMSALGISAIASVPREAMQEGVALTDDVSEIRTKRHQELTSDGELHRLGRLQAQYRENLPLMKRSAVKKPAVRGNQRVVRKSDRRSDRVKMTSASAQRVSPRKAQKRVVTKRTVSRR